MKKIFIGAIVLLLIGAGCTTSGTSRQSATDGGIFKSINSGTDWTQNVVVPTARGIGTLATTNIAVLEMDPRDNSFLYIGTENNGMLYSEDSGASWRLPRASSMQEGTIRDIEVDPKNSCRVYVAKGSRLYGTDDCMRTFKDDMYVETRQGVTVSKVVADWYDGNVVWLGLSNGDLLKSEDGGKKWKPIFNSRNTITDILISNKDSRMIMLGLENGFVQRTVDGGETWESLEQNVLSQRNVGNLFGIVQTSSSDTVIASTKQGLFRTKDFGTTWETLTLLTKPSEVSIFAFAVDPKDGNRIYYSAGNTFYRTADGGGTWETKKMPSTRQARSLLIDPNERFVLYIGVAAQSK